MAKTLLLTQIALEPFGNTDLVHLDEGSVADTFQNVLANANLGLDPAEITKMGQKLKIVCRHNSD